MSVIGRVESLWRYPVKSMRGERLNEAVVLFSGVYGDRVCAFVNAKAMKGFPFHTGREQEPMVLYTPRFREPERAARPLNWAEAQAIPPGATALSAGKEELGIEVETPDGRCFAVDDPALLAEMRSRIGEPGDIALVRSDRSLTDCRPVSIFSLQTVAQLADETGSPVDKRQFRANLYIDFLNGGGFAENDLVGKTVKIGEKVVVAVVDLDPRCKMITLHPDTAERDRELLNHLISEHQGKAGLYAAVLSEGAVRPGDELYVVR